MEDQRTSSSVYAKSYSLLPKIGFHFLTFRDLPDLIKTHTNGTKALDYGCGPGISTKFLKSLSLDVEGVDINEHMISISKETDSEGKYYVIQSGEIPTPNEYYDIVYSGFVMFYVSTKMELLKIFKEVARVLKNDGTFIAVVPNDNTYNNGNKWLVENLDYEENKILESGSLKIVTFPGYVTLYHYYWSDQDYRELIAEAGLNLGFTHKPLGKDSDGIPWIDEKRIPPINMYIVKKQTS